MIRGDDFLEHLASPAASNKGQQQKGKLGTGILADADISTRLDTATVRAL